MRTAFDRVCEVLKPHHPIYAEFTIVALDDRSRDALHFYLHRNLGGLMPRIVPFEQYKADRLRETTGLLPLEEEEAFFRFHLLCRSQERTAVPEETAQLFSFLRLLNRFSVGREELRQLDRLTPEQWERLEGIFSLGEEYRQGLAKEGHFFLPFEEESFRSLGPRERDLFVGLPLLTPAHDSFLSKIPRGRLFVPEALFGPQFPQERPEYESAYHLVETYNLPKRTGAGQAIHVPEALYGEQKPDGHPLPNPILRLSFSEITDRSALSALIAEEVNDFLRSRKPQEQMAILLLDEELAFYLWRFLFAPMGKEVNFSPWLPFHHFSPAHRLSLAVSSGEDLSPLRESLLEEMRTSWPLLDPAEQAAYEAAISLSDALSRWQKELRQKGHSEEWRPLAQYLIRTKKLHLTGSREAPIQVLGLGETGGLSFSRALILPMDRDIFPHKPFRGPYLNAIHAPRIYRAQFEAHDLLLRQFLSLCDDVHIAARFDRQNGFSPSPYFAFLATEFGKEVRECVRLPEGFANLQEPPRIPSNKEIQQFLRSFSWSFHSLQLFFSCPYHFLLKYKGKLIPPPVLEEGEEAIQLHIGNILHEWASTLSQSPPALAHWRERFEEIWKEKVGDDSLPGEEYFSLHRIYKPIVLSYLEDIAQYEKDTGTLLLFADEGVRSEKWITSTFGKGTYQLRGRLDRIQPYAGKTLILDLKYKTSSKIKVPSRESSGVLASYLEENGSLHEAHQLVVYAYLLKEKYQLSLSDLSAAFYALKETDPKSRLVSLPAEELEQLESHMDQIAGKLEEQAALEEFPPNYDSEQCQFCPYRPLCGHPNGLSGGKA